jgi:uncharacterized protein DUF4136
MQLKTVFIVAVVALSATACGYTIKTSTDFDNTIDFATYHTFFMMKGNSTGNPLLDQRATDDVRQALVSKGWAEASESDGRAAVVVHTATKTRHTYETFYDGWGDWGRWRWRGPGYATTFVEDYQVGTVVVDIFDAGTKHAIWHGVATDALSDHATKNAEITQEAITKMFRTFPPGAIDR